MIFGWNKPSAGLGQVAATTAAATGGTPPSPESPAPQPAPTGEQPAQPPLSPEEARKHALASKHVAAAFGEMVALAMRTPAYKLHALQDLEWLVAPAIVSGQFAIAQAQARATGLTTPVAGVTWAFVTPEVDQRLSSELDAPIRLRPDEWRCGDIPWIVLTLGDQRVIGGLLKQLTETIFKDRPAKLRARGADGRVTVGRLEVSGAAKTASE